MFKKAQEKTDAVSPVIGVILLVAVTVALVALTTVIVFDIGSDVSDTADATIQLDGATQASVPEDSTNEFKEGVQATIIRNENVAQFNLSSPNNNNSLEIGNSQVGDSFTLYDGTGTYSVIAELDDGSTQVLTSTDR
jgi:flagellin-like protein